MTTDDDTVTAARHALVERLTATTPGTGSLAARVVDQLHAELVAGIVLLRTCSTDRQAAQGAIEALEVARDALDDASTAFLVEPVPAQRGGGTLTERLARAQLDPELSTVRTPEWRADEQPAVQRVDAYTVAVDGHQVRATDDQAARLAAMDAEQRARFVQVMGGGRRG